MWQVSEVDLCKNALVLKQSIDNESEMIMKMSERERVDNMFRGVIEHLACVYLILS